YASADLISLGGSSGASSTVSAAPVQEGTGVIQTASGEGNVYLRAKASTSATVRDRIPHNTVVEVLKVEGGWVRVSYRGNTGYVSKDYISMN
ncbi:MAG: SH3 domain-containing protein, partial [Oscillospiraceae bacterium]|nr:SH3 domain-containing protein [Oscillospiraceae bacterium]